MAVGAAAEKQGETDSQRPNRKQIAKPEDDEAFDRLTG